MKIKAFLSGRRRYYPHPVFSGKLRPLLFAFLVWTGVHAIAQQGTNSFINFETPPIHPIAISPDNRILAVVNLPDGQVEFFNIESGDPKRIGATPVGVDPVTVRFRTTNEVWVVNYISDTINVVDVPSLKVMGVMDAPDGPCDVVFAGAPAQQLAYVSCAISNVIQIYEPTQRLAGGRISIEGDRPKAMAVSANGLRVYVAVFESGNSSTILAGDFRGLNSFPPPSVVDFPEGPHAGLNPPPNNGINFVPAINPDIAATNQPPRGGLIVKKNEQGRWMDDNGGDWTEYVSGTNSFFTGRPQGWDISDNDIAIIDTRNSQVSYVRNLMNICSDLAVNPATGEIALIGTDAINEVRFEPVLRGIFVHSKVAIVSADHTNRVVKDLNPHLDYKTLSLPPSRKRKTVGDPRAIVWTSNGARAYVAGAGSNNILLLNSEGGPDPSGIVLQVDGGPAGLALDEPRQRLYVYNRFGNSITVIDTETHTILKTINLFNPTPQAIIVGRKHFYDTQVNSGLGQAACASCHVDGRFDRLAWDLGDPTGVVLPVTITNRNFSRFPPGERRDFHPMKGVMVTQTLQDIIGHEPFHWRGDRDGIEQFNGTFTNLQMGSSILTTNEMREFKEFLASIHFPPNPYRTFSNTLPTQVSLPGLLSLGHRDRPGGSPMPNGNPDAGMLRFRQQGQAGCIHCHSLPTGLGPFMTFQTNRWRDIPLGPNGERSIAMIGVRRSGLLPFKIPALRNLNEKAGLTFQKKISRAGFGFSHDGSVDSVMRFLQDSLNLDTEQQTSDLIAFLLCLNGSDLPQGALTDADRPIGVTGQDAHAAVGKQLGLTVTVAPRFVTDAIAMARSATGRVDLVVTTTLEGKNRSWWYDRLLPSATPFRGDRLDVSNSLNDLVQVAARTNPVVFTVVTRGTGRRLGIDRDQDGYPNGTEMDLGADPANAASTPFVFREITRTTNGLQIAWLTLPGRRYQLQYKNSLAGTNWINLGDALTATSSTAARADGLATSPRERYYRVLLLPP